MKRVVFSTFSFGRVLPSFRFMTPLSEVQDPHKRPPLPREPLPRDVVDHQPDSLIQFDQERFLNILRSSRRGAAGGPSGMTAEHLRPLFHALADVEKFGRVCEGFARA